MAFVLLIAGLVLLAVAGEYLVRGSVAAAQRMNIPPLVIGLTVVAFGTSAPELIVSVEAALTGAPGLAIGNVIGSNVANVLLVLGLPALMTPVVLTQTGVKRSTSFMLAVTIVLIAMIWDLELSRLEGAGLFALLIAYMGYSIYAANRSRRGLTPDQYPDLSGEQASSGLPQVIAMIVLGSIGLAIGGKFTTDGALGIAEIFGLGHTAVGLTIVALGTSLPELAASVAAARRKQASVAIGNVVGSNIFNILSILGITALIIPLDIPQIVLSRDIWIMLGTSALLVPLILVSKRVTRSAGILLTAGYILFVIVAVLG